MSNETHLIIGDLVDGLTLEDLGIHDNETIIHLSFNEARNLQGVMWLPSILKQIGLFTSTSEIIKINNIRKFSTKINDPLERNICRELNQPEMTRFKVGKKLFWVIVGEK